MKIQFDPPVCAAVSEVGEDRWGVHQFPALSRMPDGNLLVMWSDAVDASETHGQPAPARISSDAGKTWLPFSGSLLPKRPHYSISAVGVGEYLVAPAQPYLNIASAGVVMPTPLAIADVYGKIMKYRVADLPPFVQDYFRYLPAQRWNPQTGQWQDDRVEYEMHQRVVGKREGSDVLPQTFFERALLSHRQELLYADYRAQYLLPDGRVSPKGGSYLMVSTDKGRSFQRRTTIAVDPEGKDLYGEPHLSPTADGRLVCVIRKTDQNQKPMAITWSEDGGHRWTPVRELFEFGVWPCLLLLGCGSLVLSFGRPGVQVCVDSSGTGENWSTPTPLIAGSSRQITRHTCGYTSLLPLSEDSFLIAYSDFLYRDDSGNQRKAIYIRKGTVIQT